ncbi:class I SAM-dependent methyltransferase [Methylobacterium sp. J-076]|uniref:class I SAM-dependent methyltransferase n=1 Tax=Methylobacterium sp. J-076 TaxID=2836655 RepID=UPI001FB992B6|nr:class I SAM-dependent methyltransferase [Methylobacterium sp. J-076]MCJ2012796.1 methyltransferase domain-containing protein [Methylobacterium sp. J-076]
MISEGEPARRDVYWNEFYKASGHSLSSEPSSFAKLVAENINTPSLVFEFGCGNGRDSFFFSKHGHDVVAIDGSSAAISDVDARIIEDNLANIRTIKAKIDEHGLGDRLRACAERDNGVTSPELVVYARFFLHALTAAEQAEFLAVAVQLLGRGGLLAVEFRTCDDQRGLKATPLHYRRYIDPETFAQDVSRLGFHVVYRQQGKGLARQGIDDAHVARFILSGSRRSA